MKDQLVIRKTGTIVCDLVEATPVVWQGRLYRYEYVRGRYYQPNLGGREYARFVDVATGKCSPAFGHDHVLGCAHVANERLYAYASSGWGGEQVRVFWSDDMEQWESAVALDLPGWGIYNTSVCAGPEGYLMAFECGEPAELVGKRFTIFFARSDDLVNWEVLDPQVYRYSAERYTACPAIRYCNGYYYMFYLEALHDREPTEYQEWLVRSPDLLEWELSPLNPVLAADEHDRKPAEGGRFTEAELQRLTEAVNINSSDMDLCEFEGRTHIVYSWGNQHGVEHLAGAIYDGPLEQFLQGWYA